MGKLEKAIGLLEEILNDRGVPRNIKNSIEETLESIRGQEESEEVKISTLVSVLDESSNDPNISLSARTKIWDIVSKLEELNK